MDVISTPRAARASMTAGVKWRPAVGAARRQATAEQPRREYERVIDDNQVARPQHLGQPRDRRVPYRSIGAAQEHQPRRGSICERLLSNQFVREVEIELADIHQLSSLNAQVSTCKEC